MPTIITSVYLRATFPTPADSHHQQDTFSALAAAQEGA